MKHHETTILNTGEFVIDDDGKVWRGKRRAEKSEFSKLSELADDFIKIMPDWKKRYVNGIDHQILFEVLRLKEQGVI